MALRYLEDEIERDRRTLNTRDGTDRDHRVIIVDGDGDDLRGAVHGADGEGIGQMLAIIERPHCRVGIVERIGPRAGRGHLVGTVAVVGGRSGRRRDEAVGRVVDVGVGQRAGRDRRATDDEVVVYLHDAARRAGYHRRVVGAGDGDVDLLGDQAAVLVVERDGEALDLDLAGSEILNRGIRNRVSPGQMAAGAGAGGVAVLDRGERAEHVPDRGAGRRNRVHVSEIDVGKADDAAAREVAGRSELLGDRAVKILTGDYWRIVGAHQRHRDVLGQQRAAAVSDGDGIDLGDGLT